MALGWGLWEAPARFFCQLYDHCHLLIVSMPAKASCSTKGLTIVIGN